MHKKLTLGSDPLDWHEVLLLAEVRSLVVE